MKKLILLFIFQTSVIGGTFAQCCNIFASNGTPVSTTEGTCVTLTYATADCYSAKKDSDNDGVRDDDDLCPTIAGNALNKGCPAISANIYELFSTAIAHVHFSSDSDSLDLESTQGLDDVVKLMKENKDYHIRLSGYADSEGAADYNKVLSEKRANSVKRYLNDKGIKEKRISTVAYGETMPQSNNATERGKANNRRVEFDLHY